MYKSIKIAIITFFVVICLASCSNVPEEKPIINEKSGLKSNISTTENETDEKPVINDESESESDIFIAENAIPLSRYYVTYDLGSENLFANYILEIGDTALIYTTSDNIFAFNKNTGEKLYSFETNLDKDLLSIEAINYLEDYDYYITAKTGIHYYNSADPNAHFFKELPQNVIDDISSLNTLKNYSIFENKIVWENSEGIMYMNLETGNEKLILSNDEIEENVLDSVKQAPWIYEVPCGAAPYKYFEPCFIDNGNKVVVQISSSDYIYFAVVLYNIENDELLTGFSYAENFSPRYPLSDRFISLMTGNNIKIIDANKTISADYTLDYNDTFYAEHGILVSYSSINDLFGFKLYCCSNNDPSSERTALNNITDDETIASVRYIGKENIYLEISNEENTWICSVPYIEGD